MPVESASSFLNLGINQVADLKDPQLNNEFQGIYNALHTLNAYMEGLRKEYEGSDSQNPAESLRFRRRVKGIALQPITAGSIVSPYPGGFVNGCAVERGNNLSPFFYYPKVGVFPAPRYSNGFRAICANVALTDAAAGEEVTVGVDSGAIAVSGFVPGQLVWALDRRHYSGMVGILNKNFNIRVLTGASLYGDGRLYLGDNSGSYTVVPGAAPLYYEGYFTQAPYQSGDWIYASVIHAFPVGVCIAPGYVLITDNVVSPWPP